MAGIILFDFMILLKSRAWYTERWNSRTCQRPVSLGYAAHQHVVRYSVENKRRYCRIAVPASYPVVFHEENKHVKFSMGTPWDSM